MKALKPPIKVKKILVLSITICDPDTKYRCPFALDQDLGNYVYASYLSGNVESNMLNYGTTRLNGYEATLDLKKYLILMGDTRVFRYAPSVFLLRKNMRLHKEMRIVPFSF